MTDKMKKLAELNGVKDKLYGQEVNKRIRKRYTVWDEISLIRQKDEKPDEFAAYNAFVEECKAQTKAEMYGKEEENDDADS